MKITRLESDEIWPLLNILNEVCNGFYIHNFESVIGTNKKKVAELLDKISIEENKPIVYLDLNEFELNVLNKSFAAVLREIEEWEFQTRIGISIDEALKIKNKINASFGY